MAVLSNFELYLLKTAQKDFHGKIANALLLDDDAPLIGG